MTVVEWPPVAVPGTVTVECIEWLRQALFCRRCDEWRVGKHPKHRYRHLQVVR